MNNYPFDLDLLIQICRRNGVVEVRLFGSMVRGDYTQESDIDLLVKFSSPIGLIQFVHLKEELAEALGRGVDLVTEGGLSPYLYDEIMNEAIVIYQ